MIKSMERLLGSWGAALAMIVFVAALGIQQIDKYMFSYDSLHSFLAAGLTAEGTFSPSNVLYTLQTSSPDQGPLYYLILNQWGNLLGDSIAMARMLTLFCALLFVALMYRLAYDALAPTAGVFAVAIAASNAFYAYYVVHIRFYPLLVLLSTLVIWLYLRIAELNRDRVTRRDYLVLCLACFALVTTHAYGFLIYVVLSLYHLLFVRMDRRWLALVATALVALPLASPLLIPMFTSGVEFARAGHEPHADDFVDVLGAWFDVTANGSPLLILLSIAGIASGWKRFPALKRCTALFAILLLGIALLAGVTGIMSVGLIRHLLPGMPVAVLFLAGGLYALYRWRRALAVLLMLWVIAGLAFAESAPWYRYVQHRLIAFQQPPWHLVRRVALQANEQSRIFSVDMSHELINIKSCCTHSLRRHWFTRHGIDLVSINDAGDLKTFWRSKFDSVPVAWLVYENSRTEAEEIAELDWSFGNVGFRACTSTRVPPDIEMVKYSWITLACQPPAPLSLSSTALIDYLFFGAALDSSERRLYLSHRWTPLQDFDSQDYSLSYQLITDDWRNIAQLDLPLVAEGEPRQFAIDVSHVPAGTYRLMLVLYSKATGERLAWKGNPGQIPELLELVNVTIEGDRDSQE